MKFKTLLTTIVLFVMLAACGGSSDGDSESDLNGIYQGTFIQQGLTVDLIGLIQSGRIIAINQDADTVYDGNIRTTDSSFSGNVTAYEQNGPAFDDVSLQGTFESRSFVAGSFSDDSDGSGSFLLEYDPTIYERDSNLSLLNGVWSDEFVTVTVSIDSDGSFTGSDTDDCVYSGSISIMDSSFNVYQVIFTVSSCDQFNGSYSGFLSLFDQDQQNDTMVVTGSNSDFLFLNTLTRQ